MDFKILVATFTSVFLAEIADKTQLVGLNMTAKSGKPAAVFVGSMLAFLCVTALTVAAGTLLGKYIRPEMMRYVGGGLFIVMGALMLAGKL